MGKKKMHKTNLEKKPVITAPIECIDECVQSPQKVFFLYQTVEAGNLCMKFHFGRLNNSGQRISYIHLWTLVPPWVLSYADTLLWH